MVSVRCSSGMMLPISGKNVNLSIHEMGRLDAPKSTSRLVDPVRHSRGLWRKSVLTIWGLSYKRALSSESKRMPIDTFGQRGRYFVTKRAELFILHFTK